MEAPKKNLYYNAVTLSDTLMGMLSTSSRSQGVDIGPCKLTRFEKARIVGARAIQISMGAPMLISIPKKTSSPIEIALEELESGKIPMTIRRTLPDGTYQDIPLKWLQ